MKNRLKNFRKNLRELKLSVKLWFNRHKRQKAQRELLAKTFMNRLKKFLNRLMKKKDKSKGTSKGTPKGESKDKSRGKPKGTPQESPQGKSKTEERGTEPAHGTEGDETQESEPLPTTKMNTRVFRERLKSIMTDNKYDRISRNRRRGRLDLKNLPRSQTGSENVFKQKTERKNKEYNILLLVDISGSMGAGEGSPLQMAIDSATNLSKAFDGLNLNLQVNVFNHDCYTVLGFDQKLNPNDLEKEMYRLRGGGTELSTALDKSIKDFQGREGKNILVLITDGDADEEKHEIHHRFEANKHIIPVGIGIHAKVDYLELSEKITDINQLLHGVVRQLKAQIKRG